LNNNIAYEVNGPVYTNDVTRIWCGNTSSPDGRTLFVKILNYGEIEDPNISRDMLSVSRQEADTLRKVSTCTKFIPKYIDSWDDKKGKRFVIIMQKAPGKPLREWMDRHKKDELTGKDIFLYKCIIVQICEIMLSISRKFPIIVHRDLKPENIYINFNNKNKKWEVYIIDFGCATLNHVRNVGTNNYQAPEQLGMKNTSVSIMNKTDIFAIGQIFYEMLLGKVPVIGEDYLFKARDTSWVEEPALPEYMQSIGGVDSIHKVIQKMTCLNQEDRDPYEKILRNLINIRVG